MRFYKKKYLIALYDKEDELLTVLDNIKEFMDYTRFSRSMAATTLSNIFNGSHKSFHSGGKKIFVYFIDMEEEDED